MYVYLTIVFTKKYSYVFDQGWGAGAGCFWLLGARALWKKKTMSPSRSCLEKKSSSGATKKLASSSVLREDKSIRKLYFSYYSLCKIFLLYFCSFTLLVCGEKNILPNLNNSQEMEPELIKICRLPSPVFEIYFIILKKLLLCCILFLYLFNS